LPPADITTTTKTTTTATTTAATHVLHTLLHIHLNTYPKLYHSLSLSLALSLSLSACVCVCLCVFVRLPRVCVCVRIIINITTIIIVATIIISPPSFDIFDNKILTEASKAPLRAVALASFLGDGFAALGSRAPPVKDLMAFGAVLHTNQHNIGKPIHNNTFFLFGEHGLSCVQITTTATGSSEPKFIKSSSVKKKKQKLLRINSKILASSRAILSQLSCATGSNKTTQVASTIAEFYKESFSN